MTVAHPDCVVAGCMLVGGCCFPGECELAAAKADELFRASADQPDVALNHHGDIPTT